MTVALNNSAEPEILQLGDYDQIPISELLAHLWMIGIVGGINDPMNFNATMEAFNRQAVLTVPVFQGGPGDPGTDGLGLRFENDSKSNEDELPTDLGDYDSDIGKFWVFPVIDPVSGDAIASTIYIWSGVEGGKFSGIPGMGLGWIQLPYGNSTGPMGIYADILPMLNVVEAGTYLGPNATDSWIAVNDNGIQTITISGTMTAGNLALRAVIGNVAATSVNIPYNTISAATLQTALAGMTNVGAGNVIVIGENPYTVAFAAELDSQGVDLMTVASTPTGATVTIDAGSATNPLMLFNLAIPQGVQGPSAALGGRFDVDFQTNQPSTGDVFLCSDRTTPSNITTLAATGNPAGGTIPAGHYFYVATATMPNGETLRSNEVGVTLTGSTSSVVLTWSAPAGDGSTGYRIYRGTTAGQENELVGVIGSGDVTTFTDTGISQISAEPPTTGMPAGYPIWIAGPPEIPTAAFYTVPEAAFVSAFGIEWAGFGFSIPGTPIGFQFPGTPPPIVCAYTVPPQPSAWMPMVFGQMIVEGVNISLSPLKVAADVFCNGELVAAGVGNTLGTITLGPSYGGIALTPGTSTGVIPVPENTSALITVRIVNEGIIGVFDYHTSGSQLSILCIPVYEATTLQIVGAPPAYANAPCLSTAVSI